MRKLALITACLFISFATLHRSVFGGVSGLITFKPGTPAKASEVNQNFDILKSAIESNTEKIENLEKSARTEGLFVIDMDEYYIYDSYPTGSRMYQVTRWDLNGDKITSGTMVWSWVRDSDAGVFEMRWKEISDIYKFDVIDVLKETSEGLFVESYKMLDENEKIHQEVVYENPLKIWPKGLWELGRSWGGGYIERVYAPPGSTEPAQSYPRIVVYHILGFETVVVPAGTFENCLVIARIRGSRSDRIQWLSKEVGTVKMIYTDRDSSRALYELVEYNME